ncbi:MAG: S-layer homology domain-containing protein, partial [Bacillota bacterium]|nr:S-layer homology domain-containing protein [Bacillota bacterium]
YVTSGTWDNVAASSVVFHTTAQSPFTLTYSGDNAIQEGIFNGSVLVDDYPTTADSDIYKLVASGPATFQLPYDSEAGGTPLVVSNQTITNATAFGEFLGGDIVVLNNITAVDLGDLSYPDKNISFGNNSIITGGAFTFANFTASDSRINVYNITVSGNLSIVNSTASTKLINAANFTADSGSNIGIINATATDNLRLNNSTINSATIVNGTATPVIINAGNFTAGDSFVINNFSNITATDRINFSSGTLSGGAVSAGSGGISFNNIIANFTGASDASGATLRTSGNLNFTNSMLNITAPQGAKDIPAVSAGAVQISMNQASQSIILSASNSSTAAIRAGSINLVNAAVISPAGVSVGTVGLTAQAPMALRTPLTDNFTSFVDSLGQPVSWVQLGYAAPASSPSGGRTGTTTEAETPADPMENFSLSAPYNGFDDVDESRWYGSQNQGSVADAVRLSIMEGDGDGSFRPEDSITLAEIVKIAAVMRSIYLDDGHVFDQESGENWWDCYVDYAAEKGIIHIEEDGFTDFSLPATRAQVAYVFAGALPEEEFEAVRQVDSLPDVQETDLYGAEIFLLYRAGVLQGTDEDGTFCGDRQIIRAEVAAMVVRVALPEERIR